jgi:endonuclease/exonuclease/phosphatase family metal-dependent hydrolase
MSSPTRANIATTSRLRSIRKRCRGICLLLIAVFLAACAKQPLVAPLPQPAARATPVVVDPETGEHSLEVSVLSYNVAGLPWPLRSGTGRAMDRIKQAMNEEFEQERPDFLLLQEAFVPSATRIADDVGYSNFVRGPTRGRRSTLDMAPASRDFVKGRRRFKGERFGRIVNSGLVLATDYPIDDAVAEPFGRRSCAGFDCLANKGMMLVTVRLPELPEPLFLLNTHLNSGVASGVPYHRSLYAHRRQVREIEALLKRDWQHRGPLIYAGDFNSRNAPDRFEFKDERLPGELAHRFCRDNPDRCSIEMSWDSDEPWMDTQDLQGYADGPTVRIEPVAIAAMFDEPVDGKMLSDHDGLLVTYRLRWMPEPSQDDQEDS